MGKGYYSFTFSSDAARSLVWEKGAIALKPGTLRLMRWTPNFSPAHQKNTNAQVWVNFWDLGLEFWEPRTLFEIANGIGVPVKIDQNTLERKFGLFARVLIDIDLSVDPPCELVVRRKNGESVVIEVGYERLPQLCSHCGNVGHSVTACKIVQGPKASGHTEEEMVRGRSRKPRRRRRRTKQVYVPKVGDVAVDKGKKVVIEPVLHASKDDGEGPSFTSRSPPHQLQLPNTAATPLLEQPDIGNALMNEVNDGEGLEPENPMVMVSEHVPVTNVTVQDVLASEDNDAMTCIRGAEINDNMVQVTSDDGTEVSESEKESASGEEDTRSWYEDAEREVVDPTFTQVASQTRRMSTRKATNAKSREAYDALTEFVRSHNPEVLCIAEPFVSLDSINISFWRSLGMRPVCTNDRGSSLPNLWVLCKTSLIPWVRILFISDQQVSFQVKFDLVNCFLTAVYARTTIVGRHKLWEDIADVKGQFVSGPWIVFGDFNAVLGAHEKKGGSFVCRRSCEEFQAMSDVCELIHVDTKGAEFTWVRRRGFHGNVELRLDRCLASLEWLDTWDQFDCCTLPRTCSDHNPLLMSFSKLSGPHYSLFRFKKMWLDHENFREFVKNCWTSASSYGCPFSILQHKLRVLRKALRRWNWEVFGDVHRRVKKDLEALAKVQEDIAATGGTDDDFAKENELQANLSESLRVQESFWKEKARLKWLSEGDRNSAFFHAMCRTRRNRSSITLLRDGNQVFDDPHSIQDHIVNYYMDLFAKHANYQDSGLVSRVIPSMVTEEENASLTSVPLPEEIWGAVKSMDLDSAPGPDGFNGHFFVSCWDIVGVEVIKAVQYFFTHGQLSASFNSGLIILIPKVDHADSIKQFRPIALTNFVFKIIPKILALRLSSIASHIVSP
ncbi:hypothetical protein ACLB2K_035870 [Fragaria x ananassa]